jgi:hypothetical protein
MEGRKMFGDKDASDVAYCCVSLLQQLAYISQPKALVCGKIYYAGKGKVSPRIDDYKLIRGIEIFL